MKKKVTEIVRGSKGRKGEENEKIRSIKKERKKGEIKGKREKIGRGKLKERGRK